ncbi:MAG: tRNA lysidine(34) synthetase TilS [Sinobacteraceae bacterium]|nr:tRNA lysidine(34) synthetase TilS [Nevskiaceae bacterium]
MHVQRDTGTSLEEAARHARYAMLAQVLRPGEILLTAHQQDDQLETVLLQLLRGAGVRGLAAMPECAPFGSGLLLRPLLSRSRRELEAWVRHEQLSWLEDSSNQDQQLDRNYLRAAVLPLIRRRWPGAATAVSRSARHAAEAQRLLDVLARNDVERAGDGADLSVSALRTLSMPRRRNALRFWIVNRGVRAPDARRLEELSGPVLEARADAKPLVSWPGAEVQRHAGRLSLVAATPSSIATDRASRDTVESPASIEWDWRVQPTLQLPAGRGLLELCRDRHGPVALDKLPAAITVRWRCGGEQLRLTPRGARRPLKKLLQESAVPPALRTQVPLLFAGKQLLAAGAWWVDASIQAIESPADEATRTRRSVRPRGRFRWSL